MRKSKFTEEQIIGLLKQAEAGIKAEWSSNAISARPNLLGVSHRSTVRLTQSLSVDRFTETGVAHGLKLADSADSLLAMASERCEMSKPTRRGFLQLPKKG